MSEKAKALVAETVDQLNKLPDSKKIRQNRCWRLSPRASRSARNWRRKRKAGRKRNENGRPGTKRSIKSGTAVHFNASRPDFRHANRGFDVVLFLKHPDGFAMIKPLFPSDQDEKLQFAFYTPHCKYGQQAQSKQSRAAKKVETMQ